MECGENMARNINTASNKARDPLLEAAASLEKLASALESDVQEKTAAPVQEERVDYGTLGQVTGAGQDPFVAWCLS